MEKEQIPIINEQLEQEKNNLEQKTIEIVKEKTREILAELPELHGWDHTVLVAHYAKLLAIGEEKNTFHAEMASWTHDWGRAFEKDDIEKRPHAKLSGLASKDFYRLLYEEGKIDAFQYGDIQRAIRRHSGRAETNRDTLRITRDADKLSRFDPLGFYHDLLGCLKEEKLPLYAVGQPIIRSADAPIMEWPEVKCVIDGLNFCLDFEKMAETNSAKKLFEKLNATYKSFLNLFSRHSDLLDGELWTAFSKKYADEFKKSMEEFNNSFAWTGTKKDFEKWLEFYEQTVPSDIYSEQKFEQFYKNYQNNKLNEK